MRSRRSMLAPSLLVAALVLPAIPAAAAAPPDAGPVAARPQAADAAATTSEDQGIGARINGLFAPVAKAAARVMFWDPFAAVGLYDPVLYDEDGKPLRNPDGTVKKTTFPFVVIWLIFASLFFTLKLKFINFRGFTHAIGLINGRYTDPDSPGELTHFQALSTAVSGTVGLGNIAGVAIAISVGGPGATFWMVLAGLLGMATKFAECTLGVKYREIDDSGEVSGGPPYYLSRGLSRRGLAGLGKALAAIWALFAIGGSLGGGNMFQANQSFSLASETFPFLQGNAVWFGLVLAVVIGIVIVGGVEQIGSVTGKLVPLMAGTYVVSSLVIIGLNLGQLDDVFSLIIHGALSPDAAEGGFIGVMVIGLRRAAFSNEAGVGTAAIAHSVAKTREPAAEGFVGLHEPFIDTVVICTMTAVVLIITGHYSGSDGANGAALTAAAFGSVASWFPYLLTVSIILFSLSTQISFSYYGAKCFDYCFGGLFERLVGNRDVATHVYRVIFLVAVVVGTSSSLDAVMAYSDMIIFGLIMTNTVGLFLLSGEVKAELESYLRRLRSGEIRRFR